MVNEWVGLTQRFWMLRKTDIDSLDRSTEWLHDGEDESIAEDKGHQHIQENSSITDIWGVSISLVN